MCSKTGFTLYTIPTYDLTFKRKLQPTFLTTNKLRNNLEASTDPVDPKSP